MKHPVLTRIFAVVLVLMSLILIAASSYGIARSKKDYDESMEDFDLLESRTDEYEELLSKLSGKTGYAESSENYDRQLAEYEADVSQFHTDLAMDTATKAGIKETRKTLVDLSGMLLYSGQQAESTMKDLDSKAAEAESGKAQAEQALAGLEMYTQIPGVDENSPLPPQMADMYPDISTVGEAMAMLQSMIDQANAGINQIAGVKSSILSGIGAGWAGINDAVFMLNNKEKELNEDYDELSAEKQRLEAESDKLKTLESELAQLKSDELRFDALEGLLMSDSSIKSLQETGTAITDASRYVIESGREYTRTVFNLQIVLNSLGILAGVCAFLGLPSAFEKTHSRIALVFPVALFTLLSAASLAIHIYTTSDVSYAALMSAVFGLIQLIIVISDKEKNTASYATC